MRTIMFTGYKRPRSTGRRRSGVVMVYCALGMVVFLGMTGMVVDIGLLHKKEAEAQRAADAAALAGAQYLPDGQSVEKAEEYARINGYDVNEGGVVVNGFTSPSTPNQFTATVLRPEKTLFMRIFGFTTKDVGAIASAEIATAGPLDISGGGHYGMNDGVANPSIFGPYAEHQFGDPYSTKYLQDGTDNPEYSGSGYDYAVNIPADYVAKNGPVVNIQIFDPDRYGHPLGRCNSTDCAHWYYSGHLSEHLWKWHDARYSQRRDDDYHLCRPQKSFVQRQ